MGGAGEMGGGVNQTRGGAGVVYIADTCIHMYNTAIRGRSSPVTRATTTNKTTPVTKPASLRAAGTPIIPAPTMELITLKEAPRIPLSFSFLALLVLAVPEDEGEAPSYRYINV